MFRVDGDIARTELPHHRDAGAGIGLDCAVGGDDGIAVVITVDKDARVIGNDPGRVDVDQSGAIVIDFDAGETGGDVMGDRQQHIAIGLLPDEQAGIVADD